MRVSSLIVLLAFSQICAAQVVQIEHYSTNPWGQVQLQIQAEEDKYYLLSAKHAPNNDYETITSMTLGVNGPLIISEPLGAYPLENYTITEHSIANPDDTDGDGIDDITEFNNLPTNSPFNFAEEILFEDGTIVIPDEETFQSMAVVTDDVPWAPFLNNQQFVKFGILDIETDNPRVYFINSNTHFVHGSFFSAIGFFGNEDGSGEIIYNPNDISPNGVVGSYSFSYSFGDAKSFENTQRTFELLAANMPFLRNNLKHFVGAGTENIHESLYASDFEGSRIEVDLESEFFGDVDFIPFNQAEGFGFFRAMTLDENPGSRDIVLYDALPNSLPRVGGIITSVVQTPLSHVNLRAIQDNVPNAYIKEPLEISAIAELLNGYIYYKVEEDSYEIREATLDEVNAWFENLRPTEPQIPIRDLSFREILPLDDIDFSMSTAFGAKCSNVATMRTFGFSDGTIPNGFGIPFYYYDEFMKFNNFYQQVEEMILDPIFQTDLEVRIEALKEFRKEIRASEMPQWMLDDLQEMHDSFPEGTRVRCRSSTNNEDLPGFSGAGLYTSKTQHLDEGHISKSIKQVFASMWNFRAYEEREFYRVDHFVAAMGILCHPNFQDEKSNGVGVSIDPIYNSTNTFYLNTQVGESLVTNPDVNSIPEEILLYEDPNAGFVVLRESNLVEPGELVMSEEYLSQMRDHLTVIHNEFEVLYDLVGAEGFGMDIEYKVTATDQLVIKQARPWVSFWSEINATFDLGVAEVVSPQNGSTLGLEELVSVNISNGGLEDMSDFELSLYVNGDLQETLAISETVFNFSDDVFEFTVPQDFSTLGDYDLSVIVSHPMDGYSQNDTLDFVLSNIHALESGIDFVASNVLCTQELEIEASITNLGETTIESAQIEVEVNGLIVDVVDFELLVPYLSVETVTVFVNENLEQANNEIALRLLTVNGAEDALSNNNEILVEVSDLDSGSETITLSVTPDDFPQENTWELVSLSNNEIIGFGTFENDPFSENYCLPKGACYSLTIFDGANDGICCDYGNGDFSLLDNDGEIIASHDGEFDSETEIEFCLEGEELVSGIADPVLLNGIEVYPNPVQDDLIIQFGERFNLSDEINIEVYDSQGRLLDTDVVSAQIEASLSFSNYAPGLYVVKCFDKTVESRVKVTKN